jgi:hypothetical protein
MFSVYLLSAYHLCFLRHIKHAIYTYDAAGNRIKAVESVLQPPTPTPTPTATPTATPTPTPTVTPTATPADLIFADSFESGDFSAWSYYTPSGDLFVDTAARIVGNYGLRNVVDNNGARFVQDDTPGGESSYHARFYFDPNSIQMNSGNHVIFQGYKYNGMELPAAVVRVEVGKDKDTGLYQVRAAIRKNNNDWIFSPAYTFSDYHHAFEIRWRAGTGIARPDGVLQFWLDGELKYSQTNVDNHTHRVDFARLGVVEPPDVGTAGSHCLDHFESRQNSYIGLADPGFGFVCLDHSQGASEERTSEAEGPRTSGAEGPRTSGAEGPRTGEAEVPRTGEAEVPRTEWGAGRQPGILTGELLFADGFESGDLSAWDGYTDDPYLSVTTAAALIGVYGLSVRGRYRLRRRTPDGRGAGRDAGRGDHLPGALLPRPARARPERRQPYHPARRAGGGRGGAGARPGEPAGDGRLPALRLGAAGGRRGAAGRLAVLAGLHHHGRAAGGRDRLGSGQRRGGR